MALNCSDYLTGGLTLTCKKGVLGGIDSIDILETEKISGFTKDSTGLVTGVTYSSTATTGFYKFYVEKFTAEAKEEGKVSTTGDFVEQTVALEFVKAQASTRNQVLLLTKRPVTIKVNYNTGKSFILGETKGLNATTYTQGGGKAAGDANGYSISLFGTEPDLAPEVSANVITTL